MTQLLQTIWIWLLIVWRPVHADESGVYRLSASVAWELAQSLAVPLVDKAGRSFFGVPLVEDDL